MLTNAINIMPAQGFFGIPQIGATELLIVLAIVLVLFGARRLPGLARALGRSLSEFKRGREEGATPPETDRTDNNSDKWDD